MPVTRRFAPRRAVLAGLAATALPRGAAAEDKLAALIGLVGERLAQMRAVAESKWNTGAPVEDVAREERLVADVAARAHAYGLAPGLAAAFFRAQIEAAKCVESALIAQWAAVHAGPFAAAADVQSVIRPQLDRLTPALLAALAGAVPDVKRGDSERIASASALADPVMAVAMARALQPLLALAGARAAP